MMEGLTWVGVRCKERKLPAPYAAPPIPSPPRHSISPGPERARYLSGELVKENMGTFSPGPKYKMPDTIGNAHSLKYSFGRSDRAYDDIAIELKEKLGALPLLGEPPPIRP